MMIGDDEVPTTSGRNRPTPSDQPPQALVDTSTPSVARIYDYALGGKDNYVIDRRAAHEMMKGVPDIIATARENRSWLCRAVRFLASEGIRQFVDHGSGLPTRMNVHQVAHQVCPEARVVYVDHDPVVLAHGRALLDENHTCIVAADMTRPHDILADVRTRSLIDFTQPVAALYASVVHCLPDDLQPRAAVARMLDALPSGSYLLLSHLVSDDEETARFLTEFMTARTVWGRVRSESEVAEYFDGLDIVDPGLVNIARWRPDTNPAPLPASAADEFPLARRGSEHKVWEFGGVARKP